MRVYEFCKEHGIAAKDAVAWLNDGGFAVGSHMSVLSEEARAFLEKKIAKKTVAEPEQVKVAAPQQPVSAPKNVPPAEPKQDQQQNRKSTSMAQQQQAARKPAFQHRKSSAERSHRPLGRQSAAKVQPEARKKELPLKPVMLGEFADVAGKPASEIILLLLKQGKAYTKNHVLDVKTLQYLAPLFGVTLLEEVSQKPEEVKVERTEGTVPRPPVVVVIGHVDHGKTSFLDYVRKTRVASREKGGITQHLGAYEAQTKNGTVVFLDTPGHEAFTHMRKRGLSVADITILMVAADDGIMPQTIEAIHHAEQAGVPVIVALNKIDKVDATQIERVKGSLAQYGLLPEDWGGQTMVVPISAKTGENVDQLLDMLALQSEVMELRARTEGAGEGYVLESKMEKGRGAVATVLLQHGQLQVGDFFVSGATSGKVSALVNSAGERLKAVGPAVPVQLSGFDALPEAGEPIKVVSAQGYREFKSRPAEQAGTQPMLQQEGENMVRVIFKVDTNSSKEALLNAVSKLTFKTKKIAVVSAGIGNINESDVQLASTTGAVVYGFGVKPESGVIALAQRLRVPLALHYIIYHLVDELSAYVKSLEQPDVITVKMGEAIVRKVFDIKNVGVIAGCYVKDGKIIKGAKAVVFRGNRKIGEGEVESLQRDKRTMKEVAAGFECAFIVTGHGDFQLDDRIECFIQQTVPQS